MSGFIAPAGGLSLLFGYRARLGAWLLVLFLVPVTLMMHAFWAVSDPMMYPLQLALFLRNLMMLGGALLVAHVGAGSLSLDALLTEPVELDCTASRHLMMTPSIDATRSRATSGPAPTTSAVGRAFQASRCRVRPSEVVARLTLG